MNDIKYTSPDMQYAFQETEGYSIVKAEYVKCDGKASGNPLIEALPALLDKNGRQLAFNHGVVMPKDIEKMSRQEKLDSLECLLDFRTELPMDSKFELAFHKLIRESYLKRETVQSDNSTFEIQVGNDVLEQNRKLVPSEMSSPVGGIALTGIGGSGKSTSVNAVLNLYPQTIIHNAETCNQFVQIPYLIVNIHPDYNLGSVYVAIGEAIDRALGNITPFYEEKVHKARQLGDKARLIKQYINIFHVGVLLLDEIQMISLHISKRGYSISNFLVLANETSVGLVAIGTREAFLRLFDDPHNARRFAYSINSETYIENKQAFSLILRRLWQYRYFNEPEQPSNEMIDVMYEETNGIINMLMILWTYLQAQYILAPKKITVDFIKRCSNKSMDLLKFSVDSYNNKSASISMKKAISTMMNSLSENSNVASQNGKMVDIARYQAYTEEKVLEIYPELSKRAIMNAFTKAYVNSGSHFSTETAAVRETLKVINGMMAIREGKHENANRDHVLNQIMLEEIDTR